MHTLRLAEVVPDLDPRSGDQCVDTPYRNPRLPWALGGLPAGPAGGGGGQNRKSTIPTESVRCSFGSLSGVSRVAEPPQTPSGGLEDARPLDTSAGLEGGGAS